MCIVQAYGYRINGSIISTGSCTAITTDNIEVWFDVTFSTADIGKTVHGDTMLQHPPGTLLSRIVDNATQYISDTSTRSFVIPVSSQITENGVYIINDVGIVDSLNNTLCFTGSVSLYGCTVLTVTTATSTINTVTINDPNTCASTIPVNGTCTLTTTCTDQFGASISCGTPTWSSNNTAIATVNSTTGVVTGVSVGSTTIKATATNGKYGSKTVTVTTTTSSNNTLIYAVIAAAGLAVIYMATRKK